MIGLDQRFPTCAGFMISGYFGAAEFENNIHFF